MVLCSRVFRWRYQVFAEAYLPVSMVVGVWGGVQAHMSVTAVLAQHDC